MEASTQEGVLLLLQSSHCFRSCSRRISVRQHSDRWKPQLWKVGSGGQDVARQTDCSVVLVVFDLVDLAYPASMASHPDALEVWPSERIRYPSGCFILFEVFLLIITPYIRLTSLIKLNRKASKMTLPRISLGRLTGVLVSMLAASRIGSNLRIASSRISPCRPLP